MSAERAGTVTHTAANGDETLWTTANLGEAMPGVCTPLSWSYFEHGVDWGMRHGFFDLGALRRSELDPQKLEERFVAPFFGRTALNLSLMCDLADRLPGTSAVAVQERLLGNSPEGSSSRSMPTRYPLVALRAPWIAATAIRRTREQHLRAGRWYPQALAAVVCGEGSAESALLTLTQSLELIRLTLRTHLVVAMIAQPMFDAIVALARRAGRPGLESRLLSGLETEEVRLGDDLWALGHGLLAEREFLARHGYHGPGGGLHISKPSWRADPGPLRSLLPSYAEIPEERRPRALLEQRGAARANAIDEVREALGAQWRPVFEAALPLASRFIPLRELGRSTWMRLIDGGRAAVEALGAQLHSNGSLDDPRDVSLCTVDELLRLRAPAGAELETRRRDLENYSAVRLPVVWSGAPSSTAADGPAAELSELSGVAIGGGRVEGVARVVSDPSSDGFTAGEILVCAATDPAWVSIFLLAAAVVTDTGGELSHGAIVARELGIPAVTNARDASRIIRSGDRVVVDADAGTVLITERASG